MLEIVSFDEIGMMSGVVSPAEASNNLDALDRGIALRAGQRIILGPSKEYMLAASSTLNFVRLASNAVVQCMPGCTLRWAHDTKPGNTDFGLLTAANTVRGVRWSGGTFESIFLESTVGGVTYRRYPSGSVLRLLGTDIVVEDVTIDGYNGIATVVAGNTVRLVNPTIRNPQRAVRARRRGRRARTSAVSFPNRLMRRRRLSCIPLAK